MKIVGLQRTGTNYLEHLARKNLLTPVVDQNALWWKHALPFEDAVLRGDWSRQRSRVWSSPHPTRTSRPRYLG